MFRTILSTLVLVALTAGVVTVAIGEELKCEGMIVKIEGEMVTVKDTVKELQMKIEPATKITSGGKPVMPTDLKAGQRVRCVCETKDNAMICTSLEIMRDTPETNDQ